MMMMVMMINQAQCNRLPVQWPKTDISCNNKSPTFMMMMMMMMKMMMMIMMITPSQRGWIGWDQMGWIISGRGVVQSTLGPKLGCE